MNISQNVNFLSAAANGESNGDRSHHQQSSPLETTVQQSSSEETTLQLSLPENILQQEHVLYQPVIENVGENPTDDRNPDAS